MQPFHSGEPMSYGLFGALFDQLQHPTHDDDVIDSRSLVMLLTQCKFACGFRPTSYALLCIFSRLCIFKLNFHQQKIKCFPRIAYHNR